MTGETTPAEQMQAPQIYVERTLGIIKPDAVEKHSDEIEDIILRSGYSILQKRRVHMTPEQASDFYAEHYGKLFFPSLVAYMSSGPINVMVLARDNAIAHWRELVGPTSTSKAKQTHPDSLRAIYGTDDQRNALHGSDSFPSAEREIRFFFSDSVVEPISVGQAAKDYLAKAVNPTLLKGLTELCKQKPLEPVGWLADWLLQNNPNKPNIQEEKPCTLRQIIDTLIDDIDSPKGERQPELNVGTQQTSVTRDEGNSSRALEIRGSLAKYCQQKLQLCC